MNTIEPLTYERFLQEYVLAYAKAGKGGISSHALVREADNAWAAIKDTVLVKRNT